MKMFCPNCGLEIEDDAVFCENCGESLLDDGLQPGATGVMPAQGVQQPAKSSGSKAPVIIVVVILALVAIGVAIGFATTSSENKSEQVPEGAEHEVVFETFGGTQYKSGSFEEGTIIEKPADPTKTDSTFEGWYSDAALTKSVNFPYTISGNDPETIKFYAKWTENAAAAATVGSMDPVSDPTSVLPYSSTTYLVEEDLYGLTEEQLQRAINEIYARNGYIFQQSATEKQYFESRPWYQGNQTNQDVVKSRFNQYEKENIKLMQSFRDIFF